MTNEVFVKMLAFEIEGFRVFRDRARFELKPLTLIYGRNQAGKSTLLRLLPVLADSIFGNVPVFDGFSPALMGASFKELGWLGPEPSGSPLIRLEASDLHNYVEIQLTEDRGVVPNRIQIGTGQKDYLDILLGGDPVRSADVFRAPYAGSVGKDHEWKGAIEFGAMLPSGLPYAAGKRLDTVRNAFEVLKKLQWLAASRPGMDVNIRPSRCCRPDGLDLPNLLIDRKDITDLASIWLSEPTGVGESVSVGKDASGGIRLELRRTGNESLPSHLAGEGVRWLLPILLCACWAELGGEDAPTMLAIEEMESRLHPNLQISLLERLLSTVKKGIPCVMETHSIYMLRRAQLAVAKGEIESKDLAIYWIERNGHAASLRRVDVAGDGSLLGWNPETFEEEQQLSREIFEARWKRLVGQ